MKKEKVKEAVYAAISKGSGIPCRDLNDEMRLEDCSIVDSFDFAELAGAVERKLEIAVALDYDALRKSTTVGELVDNVCAALHV